jgi:ADP-heptose:LPS heptosyltransferase
MKSRPDYLWPAELRGIRTAPRRWLRSLAFHVARLCGWVAHRAVVPVKAICVIRTDGLGDAVLFEPAMRGLADRFPEHELHLWGSRQVCDLYRATPYVTRLIETPRGGKWGNLQYFHSIRWHIWLGFALGRRRYTLAVYPAQSAEPMGNWLIRSIRAKERWVVDSDMQNQFAWQREKTIRSATLILSSRPQGGHELERNAHLARHWGARVLGWPRIHPSDTSAQTAYARVRFWRGEASRLGATGIVGIAPAGTMAVKSYPPKSWAAAIGELWSAHRMLPAFLGGAAEQETVDQIIALLPETPHLRLISPIEVLALASLVGKLDALISVDTGTAHLAVAQRVPSVVLCGGGHPGRFFPWPGARNALVLNVPMPCDGCLGRCQLTQPQCLTGIKPDDIVAACLDVTGRRVRLRVAV